MAELAFDDVIGGPDADPLPHGPAEVLRPAEAPLEAGGAHLERVGARVEALEVEPARDLLGDPGDLLEVDAALPVDRQTQDAPATFATEGHVDELEAGPLNDGPDQRLRVHVAPSFALPTLPLMK